MKSGFSVPFLCLGFSVLIAGCGGGGGSSSNNGGGNNGGGGVVTPAITSIAPTSVNAGSAQISLTINGTGFLTTSVVQVGGVSEPTTYVSSTQVTATVPASQLTSGAQLSVAVLNGSSSSGSGTPVNLQVTNPAPIVTSVAPSVEVIGAVSPVITVTGTGFVPSTTIQVNGAARTTTFTSPTQVTVALTAADVAATGSLSLTAVNPTPGGGTSTAATVTVSASNPIPAVSSVTPRTVVTGSTPTTVTINGANFVAGSTVLVNGSAVPTTYVSSTQLTISIAANTAPQVENLSVNNPAPGGGTVSAGVLYVLAPTATPVISSVNPTQFVVGSGASSIQVSGSNFYQTLGTGTAFITSTVQWNGTPLTTSGFILAGTATLTATVPAALLMSLGTASITVTSTTAVPATSNAVTVTIGNPPAPTLTSISPAGGPINTAAAITLSGTAFTSNSTVAVNGATIPSKFVSSTQMTATIPASAVGVPGNFNVTVTTPAPGGGTSAPQGYTTFLSIPNNDLVYNSVDGLLYASVPAATAGGIGNCVVGIDPYTGTIVRQIQVGTKPDKLALSTDGTQLFVGIDGAGAVAQVDLVQGKIVNQFSLGGGSGIYNAPYTAAYLAAVPSLPNSVAVAATGQYNGSNVTIFDSGIPRTGSSVNVPQGPLSFGSSASTLYVASSYIYSLTVGSTGITASTQLASLSSTPTWIQYDNGSLYLSNGQVLNAGTGSLNGTFYTTASTPANGPIVSDSTLGKAFMAVANFSNTAAVYIFDETSFNLLGSIPVDSLGTAGYPTTFRKIVRWGQNGIAIAAVPSAFTSNNQIYIFQSPLVKDLSSTPADLSISLSAPSAATTGTAISYVATVTDTGPGAATGATLAASLDSSLIINSVTPSQGSCTNTASFTCDLGGLASGASATVTVNATPTTSGTLASVASVSSSSFDPTASNNQATGSTTVTGNLYSVVPAISSISPNLVQAGSASFTLTVTGTGFNASTTVNLGANALTTTYVSPTQVNAAVSAAAIANYGWAPVTVSNPSPGGGVSSVIPLTIYDLVNVPATSILFDPYGQFLYATIPSTATGITGNSVVAIDPSTGSLGTPVSVGSQPTVMAETTDGNYLYIGLSGANSLAQFNLLNQSVTATIPLAYNSGGVAALSLAAMPGTDNTLAIGISSTWNNFGIFDVSGNSGSFRPNFSGIYQGTNPVFASPTELYAYDGQTSGAEFYRYSINTNGLTLIDGTTLYGMGGFGGGFQLANGLVYGGGGGIANPTTTPPSQIQTLPLVDFYGSGNAGPSVTAAADPSLQKDFLMLENTAGTWAYGLVRYDLGTYLPEAFLKMPTAASGVSSTWTMQRFGNDGLALLSNDSFGVNPPVVQLMLLRGPFIAPQELTTATVASLTSSSSSTIAHGSGNTLLTLTGSNFLPGVAVTWNGSYRTTTIVDSSHVTVAIPASDLANTGSASVVATNPGASASNTLTITIN